jgi:hypothetical protein
MGYLFYCDKSTTRNGTGPHRRVVLGIPYPVTVHVGMDVLEKRDA